MSCPPFPCPGTLLSPAPSAATLVVHHCSSSFPPYRAALFQELVYEGINVDVIHADRSQLQVHFRCSSSLFLFPRLPCPALLMFPFLSSAALPLLDTLIPCRNVSHALPTPTPTPSRVTHSLFPFPDASVTRSCNTFARARFGCSSARTSWRVVSTSRSAVRAVPCDYQCILSSIDFLL